MSRRRSFGALVALTVVVGGALLAGVELASGDTTPSTDSFEVDGNLYSQTAGLKDWAQGSAGTGVIAQTRNADGTCTAPAAGVAAVLVCDPVKSDATTFPGGAKEPTPSGWLPIQSSQVTPKTDITNVYAYGTLDSANKPVIVNGMERLPKSGDVHLDFEFNQVITNLDSLGNPTAGSLPQRRVNDLLVAYDLGGSVTSNLGSLEIRVFKAKPVDPSCATSACAGAYDYSSPDSSQSGTSFPLAGSGVTGWMNTGSTPAGPWKSYDDHYALTDTIAPFGFAEASIDVPAAVGSSSVCVNYINVKSRSSESVTSQLKDTTGIQPFPFCGGLTVHKYLDTNNNGTKDTGDTNGSGWSFTVQGPSSGGATGPTVCTGTTGLNGNLVCSSGSLSGLLPGTYTVTETQKTGFYNTDPGSGSGSPPFSNASTVTKTVNVGVGLSPTVDFGNACYTAVTFQVNNVPSTGISSITAEYSPQSHVQTGTATAGLTINATTHVASATVSGAFIPGDAITWGWYVNGDTAHKVAGTSVPLAGCATTESASFALHSITGTKYKDVDASGTVTTGDTTGAGFTFFLKDSTGTTTLATTTSNASGVYTFSNVAVGSYRIYEQAETGWVQTAPSSPAYRTVEVRIDSPGSLPGGDFFNVPTSTLSVNFSSNAVLPGTTTKATNATVACTPAVGTAVTTPASPASVSSTSLDPGTYTCTVVITDP